MAYQSAQLSSALGWTFNHQPGMTTSDGGLTGWPSEPWPTEAEQAQYVANYDAYLASVQRHDDDLQRYLESTGGKVAKAIVGVLVDKGLCTLADIKAQYRSLP